MEEGYTGFPTSHLLGSVPAVIAEEKNPMLSEGSYGVPHSNLQVFPPANTGYQTPGSGGGEGYPEGNGQAANNWQGFFSISSYKQYFDVDTDTVVDRLISSVHPMVGFLRKIESNPDLYGAVWISTTLVFILSALGNFATYLMRNQSDTGLPWNFDVGFVNWSACILYGYVIIVPAAFFFLLQYFGSRASLIHLWCLWGYSLFIFVPSSLLLIIPSELFRWIIILAAGTASSSFIYLNLTAYTERSDLIALVIGSALLQFALALFIKVYFFA